uniref:Uncharacterized protein n=1 Tax=Lepeophtheirus salmonis TaxID=72036 RepID=A0A0K2UNG9_LEPSM
MALNTPAEASVPSPTNYSRVVSIASTIITRAFSKRILNATCSVRFSAVILGSVYSLVTIFRRFTFINAMRH